MYIPYGFYLRGEQIINMGGGRVSEIPDILVTSENAETYLVLAQKL